MSLPYTALMLIASLLGSCHRTRESRSGEFSITDPVIARRLTSGFYSRERGFRWAGPNFTFALPVPDDDGRLGSATFTLSLYLPSTQIEQLGPVTITASGPEAQLAKITYDKGGAFVFVVKIPKQAICCTNVYPVTFSVDKYMHGSNSDRRDLAVVVTRFDWRP
jgi:hypothetical protein